MEELYQRFLDGEDSHVAQEDDPFWDPVEVVHLGSAHIWLQSLAYSMKLEDQVEFMNCEGEEEAVVHVCVTPCSPAGRWVSPLYPPPQPGPVLAENSQHACALLDELVSTVFPKSSFSHDLAPANLIFATAAKSAGPEYLRSSLMRPEGWKKAEFPARPFSIRGVGSHGFSVPSLKAGTEVSSFPDVASF